MTQSMVTFAELGAWDPFADFLYLVPTSLSNLEVSLPWSQMVSQYAATLKMLFRMTEPGSAFATSMLVL